VTWTGKWVGPIRWVACESCLPGGPCTEHDSRRWRGMEMPEVEGVLGATNVPLDWELPKCLLKMTTLGDLLANPVWAGGQLKGERCLMAFFKAGSVGGVLKVENPPLMISVAAPTLDELLASFELALRMPKVPWKRDERPLGGEKKRKR